MKSLYEGSYVTSLAVLLLCSRYSVITLQLLATHFFAKIYRKVGKNKFPNLNKNKKTLRNEGIFMSKDIKGGGGDHFLLVM